MDPEAGAVDPLPEHRERRQGEQHEGPDPERVLVRLEPPVVAAEEEECGCERGQAGDDPDALAEGVPLADAVDLGHAQRRQQARER